MNKEPQESTDLVDELHRRKVLRTTTIYALIGWCLLQLASIFFPRWGFPDWSLTLVLTAVVLGFPVVVAMSWVFDITPRGVRRDTPSIVAPGSKRRLIDLMVILLVLLTLSLLFWDVG